MTALAFGLIGNPNSGKTTLLNQLTGSRQRVGNWAGVTVEHREDAFHTARHAVRLVDLPGTYLLINVSAQASLDEQIVCHYITSGEVDVLVNVVDAANLKRDLYLMVQLRETGILCIVALNMFDITRSQHICIDIDGLMWHLGRPVVPLVSIRVDGIDELKAAIGSLRLPQAALAVDYPPVIQAQVDYLLETCTPAASVIEPRWLVLQALEGDILNDPALGLPPTTLEQARQGCGEGPELAIVDVRYWLVGEIRAAVCNHQQVQSHRPTQWFDRVALNRWLGLSIFLLATYLMFSLAVNIGRTLQPIFDKGSSATSTDGIQWLGIRFGLPGWLTVFLVQSISGRVNTALPPVPQIGLMYLSFSLLEDSSYMTRVVFVTDRPMQALGMLGRSLVPLVVDFGCNIPLIMGARILDV